MESAEVNPNNVVLIFDFGQTLARNLNSFTSSELIVTECTLVQEKLLEVIRQELSDGSSKEILNRAAESLAKVTPEVAGKTMGEIRLDFKKKKRAKTVTQNLPMYMMAVQTLQKLECIPAELSEDELDTMVTVIKKVLQREDIFVLDWEVFPDTLDTLRVLKETGYHLAIISNSSNKVMQKSMIRDFGISEFIDLEAQFVIDEGARKPDPIVLEPVKDLFGHEKEYWIIGDMLDRDVLCGIRGNIKSIYFAQEPMHDDGNLREMPNILPDYSIYCLKQIPEIVRYHKIPNRLVVGYYMDAKKLKRQILNDNLFVDNEHLEFRYLDPRIDFSHQGKIDIFIHKLNDHFAYEKPGNDYERYLEQMRNYLANHEKDVMVVDYPDNIRDTIFRLPMALKLRKAIANFENSCHPNEVKIKFPNSVPSEPDGEGGHNVSVLSGLMKAHEFKFPVLIKTDIACIAKNAHDIAVVFSEAGLKDALNLDNFKTHDVLIQEYTPSTGTVYKVYMIGDTIEGYKRASHAKIDDSVSYHMFDSQSEQTGAKEAKNNPISSTDFNLDELDSFMRTLKKEFGISFFGIDLIRNVEEPHIVSIIDVNYFPGYRETDDLQGKLSEYVLRSFRDWYQA